MKPAAQKKYLYIFRAAIFGLLSLFFLAMPFLFESTENGLGYFGFVAIGLALGYFSFWLFQKRNEPGTEHDFRYPPPNATKEKQLSYFKIYACLSLIAFPALSYITITDLDSIVSGGKAHLWWPVALVYKIFGYKTAFFFIPTLGIIILLLLFKKIKSLQIDIKNKKSSFIRRY